MTKKHILSLVEIADKCKQLIIAAENDGLEITNSNVIDLCADNINVPLSDIKCALIVAGYGERFVKATSDNT